MKDCNVYKETFDNFRPSYKILTGIRKINAVSVSFIVLDEIKSEYRVAVYGDDDFGLERDFYSEKEAWCCFLELIGNDYVSIDNLKVNGFSQYAR